MIEGQEITSTKKVYGAIAAVTGKLAKSGISKDQKNQHQRYFFRGIDDVYNALSPLLAEAQLCILPRVLSHKSEARTGSNGNVLFYVTVEMEFDFVSAEDGSTHTVRMVGEAMDSGDKGTNKAMSASFKYACLQTFCIPTEGDDDADASTHEVQPQKDALKVKGQQMANDLKALMKDGDMKAFETLTKSKDFTEALDIMKTQRPGYYERFGQLMTKTREAINARAADEDIFPGDL